MSQLQLLAPADIYSISSHGSEQVFCQQAGIFSDILSVLNGQAKL
jgi:hypothetical protein